MRPITIDWRVSEASARLRGQVDEKVDHRGTVPSSKGTVKAALWDGGEPDKPKTTGHSTCLSISADFLREMVHYGTRL